MQEEDLQGFNDICSRRKSSIDLREYEYTIRGLRDAGDTIDQSRIRHGGASAQEIYDPELLALAAGWPSYTHCILRRVQKAHTGHSPEHRTLRRLGKFNELAGPYEAESRTAILDEALQISREVRGWRLPTRFARYAGSGSDLKVTECELDL